MANIILPLVCAKRISRLSIIVFSETECPEFSTPVESDIKSCTPWEASIAMCDKFAGLSPTG